MERLSRRFQSDWAVADVSGVFTTGVNLVLGPNGAGKSTLLSMLATTLVPSRGRIAYDDLVLPRDAQAMRLVLGYIPQRCAAPPELSAREWLAQAAAARGLGPRAACRALAEDLLWDFGVAADGQKPLGRGSTLVAHAATLAQSLLGDPPVWILDEPPDLTGTDGRSRLAMLIERRRPNTTIILSTHRVCDLAHLADRVWVMSRGRAIAAGADPHRVRAAADGVVRVSRWPLSTWADQGTRWMQALGRAKVSAILPDGDTVLVRVVGATDVPIPVPTHPAQPTLEDGLFALLSNGEFS
jgi:ABC-2 type transport system ATP-binding protein